MSPIRLPCWYAAQLMSIVVTPAKAGSHSPCRRRVHRHGSLRIPGPQVRRALGPVGQPTGKKVRRIEERPQRAEAEGAQLRVRLAAPQKVHEQRCDEWTVHDEPGITLDARGVRFV